MESQTPIDAETRKSHEKIIRIYNALKREDDVTLKNLLQTEGDINYKTPETSVGVADILQVALTRRQPRLFELLLHYRADFTRKNNEGTTALLKVIEENAVGELTMYRKFQDERMNLVLDAHFKFENSVNPRDKNGMSHFHAACIANNPSVIEFFLQNGVDVDQAINADSPVFPSDTGLHLAVRNTCENVVNTLLYYKANTLLKNAVGYSPLHLVVEDYLRDSLSNEVSKLGDKYETFLRFAIRNLDAAEDFDFSKLHVACILQDQFTLRNVFEDEVTRINRVVSLDSPVCPGYTALHFAACSNIQILKLLLFKGANINVKNAKGQTPFDLCLENYSVKDIHSTLMLQEKWRSIVLSDTETKLVDVVSAMESEEEFNTYLNVTKLALTSFVLWNSPLWPGYTLLHLAVALSRKIFDPEVHHLQQKEDTSIVAECLRRGADVTVADTMGSTALHVAFYTQKMCVAKCLLDHGDEATNPVDKDNLSHFHLACAAGHRKAIDHFLSNYVNVDLPVLSTFNNWDLYVCPGSTALHISVANGEVEIAKKLLKHGADVNARDSNGFTPVHRLLFSRAFRREGDLLLSVLDLKNVTTNCGLGYLHIACYFNHAGAVEKLLKLGADINARLPDDFDAIVKEYRNYPHHSKSLVPSFDGNTPLHFAFEGDADCEIVFMLIERGADIFAKNSKGTSLLEIWLKMSKCDNNRFSRVMLSENARGTQVRLEKEFGITKLHLACFLDDLVSMKNFIGGADVNTKVYSKSPMWRGCTPLHLVVRRALESDDENLKKIIRLLIESGSDSLVADDNNDTPFHLINLDNTLASQSVISILFEKLNNFKVNPVNNQGLSLFHIACIIGHAVAIEKFLKQEVDVNQAINYTSNWHLGSTPLNLLMEYHPLLRVQSSSWCDCGDEIFLKILDGLLERGADVNATEALNDETPLMKLVTFDRVRKVRECEEGAIGLRKVLIRKLISNGANVHATNVRGNTAFELLLRQGNASWEEVELFLEAGCHFTTFNSVSRKGYLGEAFVLQRKDELQTNGLMTNLEFLKIINNAKVNKIDNEGRTALHNVVSVNDFDTEHDEIRRPYTEREATSFNKTYAELIEELSSRGCDIDHEDLKGRTALHYAVMFENNGAILGLLKNGADINIIDKYGKTAFTYCEQQPRLDHERCRDKTELAMKEFAMHIHKLEFYGLIVNKQNKQLQLEVLKAHPLVKTFLDRFRNEMQKTKQIRIGTMLLSLHDFLTSPDADVTYLNVSSEEQQEMDQFFQKIGDHNFVEIECLLKLKYKQSIERTKLLQPAVKSLNVLIKNQLPDLCCQRVLKYLKNEDLKYLIASVTRKLERQGRVVIKC